MSGPDQWANFLDPAADPELRQQSAAELSDSERTTLGRIGEVLADDAVWGEPSPGLREQLLAEATREQNAEAGQPPLRSVPTSSTSSPSSNAKEVGRPKRSRRGLRIGSAVTAAAAAAVLFFAFSTSLAVDATTYELAGTTLTPDLDATVEVEPLGAGVALTLNIKGLPPAGDGEYYAAWVMEDGAMMSDGMSDDMSDDAMSDGAMSDDAMSDDAMSDDAMGEMSGDMADTMVGVGSFHWREGGIPIELWSGVDTDRYPVFVVTLQNEGEPATASDVVVITGRLTDN
jgi:hypothetical protein